MNHTAFFDAVKAGSIAGCYLFEGPEEYIKQQALKALCAKLLPPGLEEMNMTVLLTVYSKVSLRERNLEWLLKWIEIWIIDTDN